MRVVRVRTPDELQSLVPEMKDEAERKHAENFIRVWNTQLRGKKPVAHPVEVILQLSRDARLYYTVNGRSDLLGVVRLGAGRKFAQEHAEAE